MIPRQLLHTLTTYSVSLMSILACATARSSPTHAGGCIVVEHVGDQDKPIPGMRFCIGDRGRSQLTADYEWTFWFDAGAYRSIQTFVADQSGNFKARTPGKLYELGTFEVRWNDKTPHSYLVPQNAACTYLSELHERCSSAHNVDCESALTSVLRRLACH